MKNSARKPSLFVMTDDTKNCDDVAEYLESTYPEFNEAVLVIHTNNNGEISESDFEEDQRRNSKTYARQPTRSIVGKTVQGDCLLC